MVKTLKNNEQSNSPNLTLPTESEIYSLKCAMAVWSVIDCNKDLKDFPLCIKSCAHLSLQDLANLYLEIASWYKYCSKMIQEREEKELSTLELH